MAGHSQYANIKHRKERVDNARGKLWTKLSKAIIVAAKLGGGDPSANSRLRVAITAAKAVSLPNANIERAIKCGIGELGGGNVEEVLYEGFGPHSVAILCEIATDNRNRTAGEIRKVFEHHDGELGKLGCAAWMFDRKGLFVIPADKVNEDQVMEIVLEAGADDMKRQGDSFEVICSPDQFTAVGDALDKAQIPTTLRQVSRIANNLVDLDAEAARKVIKLMQALDDHDDVQNVFANFNLPDEVAAELAAE
jgi:YebC/PmpR family DNA-binding regulatory protein